MFEKKYFLATFYQDVTNVNFKVANVTMLIDKISISHEQTKRYTILKTKTPIHYCFGKIVYSTFW